MNALKNAINVLKQLGVGVPPWVLGAIALAVPLAILAFKWFQKRAAQPKQEGASQPAASAPAPPKPKENRLWGVWRRFLQELSPDYRRSIFQFEPYVVMGAAASGKSQLIDTCTDWRRQELQLLGGSLEDPELQIRLGSRTLTFELPATLLHDTSSHGRKALLKLWRPLFRKRKPVVVVTVDAMALSSTPADEVRTLADTLRGKLNLLLEICREPIEVRVVLTHLDQVEGYSEFARFLASQQVPATLRVESKELEAENLLEAGLRQRFTDFDRLLPLALTTLSAADYLKVVAFLREGVRYLPPVCTFLAALGARNPVATNPVLERVYLTPHNPNPFHPAKDAESGRARNPLWRHQVAAVACASLGVVYLAAGYLYERRLWNPAQEAVLEYTNATTPDHERALRQQIARFTERRAPGRPMRYLPSFFSSEEEALQGMLSRVLRAHHVLPGLERALASDRPHRRSLYFLALLYATRDNSLGRLVGERAQHWAEATGLEREVIDTYLRSTTVPYGEKPALEHLPSHVVSDATNDAQPWLLFFNRLEQTFAGGALSAEELARLQQEADTLLGALKVIRQYKESPTILRELDEATRFGLQAAYEPAMASVKASAIFGDGLPTVERLLRKVSNGAVGVTGAELRLLSEFNGRLKLLLDGEPDKDGETFVFQVEKRLFSFPSSRWEVVIRNSATRELVHRFTRRPPQRQHTIFFSGQEKLDDVLMNPLSDGSFLFTGKATLGGRYTRVAFEGYVRPVLTEFTALAGRLAREERTELERFVESEVRKYASAYISEVDDYYHAFGVHAGSRDEMQILLRQLLGPGSPLVEMLHVVRDNTTLELDEKSVPLFAPMKLVLSKYAPLHKVMAEQESGASEFANYRAILEQMLLSLAMDGAAPEGAQKEEPKKEDAAAKKEAAGAEELVGLADLLSPSGRMTLTMLRQGQGSYEELVSSWLGSVKMQGALSGPFLAPVTALYLVGRKEIENTVADLWNTRLLGELSGVLRSFPFDPDSTTDARPEELQALFHPQTGRFHQLTRRFIGPISNRTAIGWSRLEARGRRVKVPDDLYETLNNVELLTRRLWDSEGNPRPLRLGVTSVPFKSNVKDGAILTLVYLHSGTSSLLNFNQQPVSKPLEIDWTRPRQARLSIETIAPSTGSKTYPPAILSEISPWSMLHLLKRAQRQDDLWSWTFDLGSEKADSPKMSVQFELQDDPWSAFVLRPTALPAAPETGTTQTTP